MNMEKQIKAYMAGQPEPKRSEMETLHLVIQKVMPECKLWFLDGKTGRVKLFLTPI